ncbi:WSD1 family O-acyltransferase [Rhodococcus erythropolis]|uniref:WSD1 family O-acyltransferase n=1 Tax=Rhodococcus erythropolis TaxID=1833 RepID=UPI0021E698E4|nr:WSD1 family O-acyltransferase [Rhodococcus erythropolis]
MFTDHAVRSRSTGQRSSNSGRSGPLAGNVRIGFTAASYNDKFWIGIQTDAEHLPPASKIAQAVERALNEIASTTS